MRVHELITEKWSQKYKSSINCSHPKGFSQKAHCAGKSKHTESIEMEMVCEACGMCQTHGNLNEIAKGAKDSNGVTKCWPGKHAAGTKKGKNGGQVRNCVPNESQGVAENFNKEFTNYQGLRPPKNIPGVNLFPGQDIVGKRVYHCTNKLEAIKKSGGLKPRRDATGEREYGRLSTDEHPFIPVIGIWFSVGKPDWVGKHCISFVIEPTDQVYVAYANTKGLKPNVVLNPIALDRLTIEGQQDMAEGLNEFAPPERGDGQENRFNFLEEFESDDGEYLIELYRNVQSRSFAVSFHRNNMQYVMYPIDGIDAGDLSDGAARYVQEIKKNAAHGSQEDFVAMGSTDLEDFIPPEQGVAEGEKHGLYYNVNKRKAAGTSRPASSPKAPTAQAWKDAAKTAKTESLDELSRILDLSGLALTADEQFDIIESMVESWAEHHGVDAETIWEDFESVDDAELLDESAAWHRSAGKSKKGGLNAKGVASYRAEHPGSKLQMAVTTKPSKLKPGSKAAKRRKSFCARMGGNKGPMKKPNGDPTRKALALRKWHC